MTDESVIDPSTGLLHRAAFLKEVRKVQMEVPSHVRRGCLLLLHFPTLKTIAEQEGSESAITALRNLLAVVETRLRSRDTLSRIADFSLCVLLRQCREKDAVFIAEQYVALLRGIIIDTGGQASPMELRYRIVPLDSFGTRARQGVSRLVKVGAPPEELDSYASVYPLKEGADTSSNKVVSLVIARDRLKSTDAESHTSKHARDVIRDKSVFPVTGEHHANQLLSRWRLKPGLLLGSKPVVCCYRLQAVGLGTSQRPLQASDKFNCVLNALALHSSKALPTVEGQLIVPVDAKQLTTDTSAWLKQACATKRVAPSDICLSFTLDSLSKDLRLSIPVLRNLNRQGVRLMLEGVHSVSQLRALMNLAVFDYLHISARVLLGSLNRVRQRQALDSLITEAHAQHQEICAAGVDSQALITHARQVGIDIGFGRKCGRSVRFPVDADSWQPPG